MAEIANLWVAGCSVRQQECGPEYLRPVSNHRTGAFQAWPVEQGFHNGFNSIYRIAPGREVWFHFAVPTPVLLGSAPRVFLDHAVILWATSEGAAVVSVATIHHEKRFVLSDRVLTGDHMKDPDDENTYIMRPRLLMQCGLQMSILVRAADTEGEVRFRGAGASFWDEAE